VRTINKAGGLNDRAARSKPSCANLPIYHARVQCARSITQNNWAMLNYAGKAGEAGKAGSSYTALQ